MCYWHLASGAFSSSHHGVEQGLAVVSSLTPDDGKDPHRFLHIGVIDDSDDQ